MSVIASTDANDFYTKDVKTGWYSVNLDNLEYKDQATEVATQCTSDARMERLKALGTAVLGGGAALLLTGAALIAIKIGMMAVGIFAFPLVIIPPLHRLLMLLGGLAVGAFALPKVSEYSKPFFTQAKEHWNYGNHLYAQAHCARLKIPDLASARA